MLCNLLTFHFICTYVFSLRFTWHFMHFTVDTLTFWWILKCVYWANESVKSNLGLGFIIRPHYLHPIIDLVPVQQSIHLVGAVRERQHAIIVDVHVHDVPEIACRLTREEVVRKGVVGMVETWNKSQIDIWLTYQMSHLAKGKWPHSDSHWSQTMAPRRCPPNRVHRRSPDGSSRRDNKRERERGRNSGSYRTWLIRPLRLTSMQANCGLRQTLTTDIFCGRFNQTTAISVALTQLALLK